MRVFIGGERYGIGMVIALLVAIAMAFICGCSEKGGNQSTLGDGKVDQVEAATIRVAVGLAFTARPDTVAPAYAASTAILALLDQNTGETVAASAIDTALSAKLEELNLDAATKQSVMDLVLLIKAKTMEQLDAADLTDDKEVVVIRDVVAIVQETAAARMGVAQ